MSQVLRRRSNRKIGGRERNGKQRPRFFSRSGDDARRSLAIGAALPSLAEEAAPKPALVRTQRGAAVGQGLPADLRRHQQSRGGTDKGRVRDRAVQRRGRRRPADRARLQRTAGGQDQGRALRSAGTDCAKISRVLSTTRPNAPGGIDPKACLSQLKPETKSEIVFGLDRAGRPEWTVSPALSCVATHDPIEIGGMSRNDLLHSGVARMVSIDKEDTIPRIGQAARGVAEGVEWIDEPNVLQARECRRDPDRRRKCRSSSAFARSTLQAFDLSRPERSAR